ncbi:MAG: helix-turn-helix domain-containing protein [Lachnospiraceae bacterium]|nr:helix-turn-helix domain-containing protein [Lachnospiraceae bacterium]
MNDNSTNSPERMLLLGKRLKECRKAAGFTQPKLVEMIESLPENNGKIRSEKHISAIERGERALSIEYATLIAKVLRVRSEYLLGYDDFQTYLDKSNAFFAKIHKKNVCIENLIKDMGYFETYASDIRYETIDICSVDTDKDIEERIAFAKEHLDIGERDMILEDAIGRKIHIKSNEMNRIYQDIEFMIKCRIEREFNDPSRYMYAEDAKGTFDKISKELE